VYADTVASTSTLSNPAAAGIAAEEKNERTQPSGLSRHEKEMISAESIEKQR
jgi:fibronectin type 3 domain-containing protein